MARNDYFVIAYRILSYLYECFQIGERADTELFGPAALEINNGYWTNIMESLFNEGYIIGVIMIPRLGGAPGIKLSNLKITQKGIEYLQDNSKMSKARDFLKSLKETIPGL